MVQSLRSGSIGGHVEVSSQAKRGVRHLAIEDEQIPRLEQDELPGHSEPSTIEAEACTL